MSNIALKYSYNVTERAYLFVTVGPRFDYDFMSLSLSLSFYSISDLVQSNLSVLLLHLLLPFFSKPFRLSVYVAFGIFPFLQIFSRQHFCTSLDEPFVSIVYQVCSTQLRLKPVI